MNRIDSRFQQLQAQGRKGLIIYIGAGDPNLEATRELALAFSDIGVDILELGVPFSDPLADGPVNQAAAQRGLASGTTPSKVLDTVAQIRSQSQIPIVLYLYFNLVHRYGLETFTKDAAQAGVDGLLILDLPPEEMGGYEDLLRKFGVHPIYLIAPTTPESRIQTIASRASGFLYYVSREGVTGMRTEITRQLQDRVGLIRRYSSVPIAVGFGIAAPEQARQVARFADAVVVGSAVVRQIERLGTSPNLVSGVTEFVKGFVETLQIRENETESNVLINKSNRER